MYLLPPIDFRNYAMFNLCRSSAGWSAKSVVWHFSRENFFASGVSSYEARFYFQLVDLIYCVLSVACTGLSV